MAKDPKRKAKLRAPRRVKPDEDLMELASVLAEHQLDANAYGWFRPPWRNGEWAIALAKHVAFIIEPEEELLASIDEMLLIRSARELLGDAHRNAGTYEAAGRIHSALVQPKINTNTTRLLAAALRCLQLKIANSHGGGHTYNEVLIPAFLPLDTKLVADAVLDFRCNDAIGTSRQLRGDRNDRQRHAFTIAWRRGLFLAAYALPQAF